MNEQLLIKDIQRYQIVATKFFEIISILLDAFCVNAMFIIFTASREDNEISLSPVLNLWFVLSDFIKITVLF